MFVQVWGRYAESAPDTSWLFRYEKQASNWPLVFFSGSQIDPMPTEQFCLQAVRVLMDTENIHKARADSLAPIMFGLSTLFVVLLGVLIVLWVDIPRVAEISVLSELEDNSALGEAIEDNAEAMVMMVQQRSLVKLTDPFGKMVQLALYVLWPLFWLEYLVSLRHSERRQSGYWWWILEVAGVCSPARPVGGTVRRSSGAGVVTLDWLAQTRQGTGHQA